MVFRPHPQAQKFWLAFMLLAVLMRGVVPAGYMPDFGAHHAGGIIPIRICTGDGYAVIKVSADKFDLHGRSVPMHKQNVFCDYAINHVFGAAPVDGALLLIIAFLSLAIFAPATFHLNLRRYFGAMSPRAPPGCA